MKALPSVHSRKGFKGLKALASHSAMLLFASLCVVFIWHDQKWWQYLLAPWIHVADMYSCRIIFIVCERESAWISAPSLPVTRPHFFSFLRDSAKWSKACKCDRIITYSFSPTPSWCLIKLQWPSCKPLESDEIWMKSAFFPPSFEVWLSGYTSIKHCSAFKWWAPLKLKRARHRYVLLSVSVSERDTRCGYQYFYMAYLRHKNVLRNAQMR